MKINFTKFKFAIGTLGVLTFFYSQTKLDEQYKVAQRSPASISNIFKKNDPQVFNDFFGQDHRMSVEFWTSRDEESIRKRARLALHSAISETLMNKDGFSKDIFKENVIASFSDKFIKSLYLLKIMNGTFQIDLHFTPEQVQNFKQLMKTNQMIDLSNTGSLLSGLEMKKAELAEEITSREGSGEYYQNIGGTITLWFKILDLNWNPINPIPNPPKNAVKGFVKYRRYFKMSDDWSPVLSLRSPNSKMESSWIKANKPRVVTVDITKPFNLKELAPKASHLEVYFGQIKYPKHYKTGPFANLNLFSKDSSPNKLILKGSSGDKEFGLEVKKLEFNLQENNFTQKSVFKTYGSWSGFNNGQKRKFKSEVRNAILGDDAIQLIKALKLDRFHKNFKEVGIK